MSNVNGSTFISLSTETIPDVRVTNDGEDGRYPNPFFNRVKKRTSGMNVMVFTNQNSNGYQRMIERRLITEGKDPKSFQLSPRTWGTRVPGLPIVEHNDRDYLEVIVLHPGITKYYVSGVETDRSMISGLKANKPAEQGGLDDKVHIRTFREDHIQQIVMNKQTFTL